MKRLWNPHINIGMYGPDDGLTTIALNLQPSADEGEAHLQALVSSKLLAAALPNWDGREEWFNRTIVGMADGSIKGGVSFQRDGRLIEAAMANDFLVFGGLRRQALVIIPQTKAASRY